MLLLFKSTVLIVVCCIAISGNAQLKYPSVLWEIKKTPTSKPSYLMGTYHVSKKSVFNIGDSMLLALKNVDIVATEVNDNTWQHEDAAYEEMNNDYLKLGYKFSNAYIYEGSLRKTNTIEKLPLFISFQPSYINYFIYRNNPTFDGLEEETYLDMFITSAGYKFGKQIRGLERYLESKVLYMQGQKDEEAQEKKDIKKIPGGLSQQELNDKIYDGYVNGTLDPMDSLNKYNYSSEAFFKKFIVKRNFNQADSIHELIQMGKTVFAAVGSAHLPGYDGVIEILRRKGYTLRPVKVGSQNKEAVEKIKQIIAPVNLNYKQQLDNISIYTPGAMHPWVTTNLLTINGYVDMANGAYYTVSKLVNNAHFFGKNTAQVTTAVDSLLYANIVGEIKSKTTTTHQGFTAINISSLVKNKDVERYKFIITPYEIIKLKVGGRREYANQKNIDSFFNLIVINYSNTQKLGELLYTTKVLGDYHFNASPLYDYYRRKIQLKNYEPINQQFNECTSLLIQNNDLDKATSLEQALKESYFSSYIIKDNWVKENLYKNINNNYFTNVPLQSGGLLHVKFVFQYPQAFIITSAVAKGKAVQPDFINLFAIKNQPSTLPNILYTNTNSAYTVNLPYALNFDKDWQAETERIVKKPQTKKDLNRNNVLKYNYENPKQGDLLGNISFQNPLTNEVVSGKIILMDSAAYLPSAAAFWTSLAKPISNNYNSNSSNFDEDDGEDDAPKASINNTNNGSKPYYTNIIYDTANAAIQSLTYINADSNANIKTQVKYWLATNKLYKLEAPIILATNKISQQSEALLNSFKPITNNKNINLYTPKLANWFANFKNLSVANQADHLEFLNNIRLGIADLTTVQNIYKQLTNANPANNILKQKLIYMVGNGYYANSNWPTASAWLQNIFNNNTTLLTLRVQALEAVLNKGNIADAAWLTTTINADSILSNNVILNNVRDYLHDVYPKNNIIKNITLKQFNYSRKLLYLHDSGYFSATEMLAAFNNIKKELEAENYNTSLKAEKELFKFKEDKDNVAAKTYYSDNNFSNIIDLFEYFYTLSPNDKFFDNMGKLILENGTKTDKLDLLATIINKQKQTNTITNKIVKQFEGDINNYSKIYESFYTLPSAMPQYLNNKAAIAESYFRNNFSTYNKPDTLHFVKQLINEIKPEETLYFFKYAPKEEAIEKIGYVVINSNIANNNTAAKPEVYLTAEQETGEETLDNILKKIARKYYFNNLLKMNGNRFYLDNKQEKGLDIND